MNTFWDDIRALLGRPVVKLIILVLVSLGLCGIYAAEKDGGVLHVIQNACYTISSPLQQAGIVTKAQMSNLSDRIFDNVEDAETVSELKAENTRLKTQLVASEKYKQEAERLQKLLGVKDQYRAEGIAAHVIGVSGNAWNQTITIGVGSDDGINAGQTVLGINGVLGQVDSTNPNTSVVRLLTDPNSGVAVKVLNSGTEGILRGSLDGVLYLEGLDLNEKINIGDVIVTSGNGGSYVADLFIGSITQIISNQSGANRKIVVSPVEKTTATTEVFVVRETS